VARGFIARRKYRKTQAARVIQLYVRKLKSGKYLVDLNQTFKNVRSDPDFGKNTKWPTAPSALKQGEVLVKNVFRTWRAKNMIRTLSPEDQAVLRQKTVAYDIFSGKKPWDVTRKFEGDYLGKPTNPTYQKYYEISQRTYSKYGDSQIQFSDYVTKINTKEKEQQRGFVVTEKNIYKHDPKNYKVHNKPIPLVTVTGISMSPYADGFVIIHVQRPEKDIVIDCEKYVELVTVIFSSIQKLTVNTIEVKFAERVNYFHGKDIALQFQKNGGGSKGTFQKGAKGVNYVNIS